MQEIQCTIVIVYVRVWGDTTSHPLPVLFLVSLVLDTKSNLFQVLQLVTPVLPKP